jgi:membrane-associated protease RseP (regulator of RpoE activity)
VSLRPPGSEVRPGSLPSQPWTPLRPPRRRRWLPALLVTLTFGTTLLSGFLLTSEGLLAADAFLTHPRESLRGLWLGGPLAWLDVIGDLLWHGGPYALSLMGFFAAHEMGHFVACQRHGVWATWPHFLPGPPLIGTFGAVIRIRGPIPNRRALFDIGVAGPLAGFCVALPVLALGVLRSELVPVEPLPPGAQTLVFGDSLLTRGLALWLQPGVAGPFELIADPVFVAGWVGMLATVMNLLPAGQFDGGHLMFAVAPRYHRAISILAAVSLWALVLYYGLVVGEFSAWTVWAVVLTVFGRRHPPVPDDGIPLGRRRTALLVAAVVILVVGFLPHPIAVVTGAPAG